MKKGRNFFGIKSLVAGLFILVMFSSSECEGPEGRIATGSYKTPYQRGHDDGFNAALAHCDSLSQEELKAEYEEGHQDGYIEGKEDGYEIGYKDGYRKGLTDGYNRGKRDGLRIGEKIGFTKGEIFGYGEKTKHILIALGVNAFSILFFAFIILLRVGLIYKWIDTYFRIPKERSELELKIARYEIDKAELELEKRKLVVSKERNKLAKEKLEDFNGINDSMNYILRNINEYKLPEEQKGRMIQRILIIYDEIFRSNCPVKEK